MRLLFFLDILERLCCLSNIDTFDDRFLALLFAKSGELLREVNHVILKILHFILKGSFGSFRNHSLIQLLELFLLKGLQFVEELATKNCAEGLRQLALNPNGDVLVDEALHRLDFGLFGIQVGAESL